MTEFVLMYRVASGELALSLTDAPHSSQNLALGSNSDPQPAQTRFIGAAHAAQNFALGRLQLGQFMWRTQLLE
jgi:hypothetical protein